MIIKINYMSIMVRTFSPNPGPIRGRTSKVHDFFVTRIDPDVTVFLFFWGAWNWPTIFEHAFANSVSMDRLQVSLFTPESFQLFNLFMGKSMENPWCPVKIVPRKPIRWCKPTDLVPPCGAYFSAGGPRRTAVPSSQRHTIYKWRNRTKYAIKHMRVSI